MPWRKRGFILRKTKRKMQRIEANTSKGQEVFGGIKDDKTMPKCGPGKEAFAELPQYITEEEVRRVCSELGVRDWTSFHRDTVSQEEARRILHALDAKAMDIPVDVFRQGLEVELEHGIHFADPNVTDNHPLLTARIVLAHLKETMDCYARLEVAEIEGDLLKAVLRKDLEEIGAKFSKLVEAKATLNEMVARQLS